MQLDEPGLAAIEKKPSLQQFMSQPMVGPLNLELQLAILPGQVANSQSSSHMVSNSSSYV
jgi:hypothetical protein